MSTARIGAQRAACMALRGSRPRRLHRLGGTIHALSTDTLYEAPARTRHDFPLGSLRPGGPETCCESAARRPDSWRSLVAEASLPKVDQP